MLKNLLLLAAASILAAHPAEARGHHKKHDVAKMAATGAAIGGAVGSAAGPAGAAAGVVAGAALGTAAAKADHAKAYPGYKYYDGWYYDGKGHRFTAAEMQQRLPDSIDRSRPVEGYKGFYGWYYDGKGHRFSYWKGAYFDDQGHRHTVSEISRRSRTSNSESHPKYVGYKYYDGWYYDGKGHRFTAEEMQGKQ